MTEPRDLAPPHEVRRIARRLEEAGYATWTVGGAVRDALARIPPGDWDLTTAARPADVQRLFRRTVPISVEHGTVGVLGRDGHLYEITTFRRDVESFGRRARVSFADTLEEDLERRDFTINAVAWHPLTGEIRDPHGGVDDLRRGVLRTVGDPAERFREDRLRVLRALRFAGRFQLRIEPATWEALRAAAEALPELSAERIREELFKVLGGLRIPSVSLRLYADSGALRVLYPELQACIGVGEGRREKGEDVWTHLLRTTDALPRYRPLLRLAALLHDVGKPPTQEEREGEIRFPQHAEVGAALAREILRRLKCSNAEIDRTTHLVAQHSDVPAADAPDAELRRWVRRVGRDYLWDLFRLRFAECRVRAGGDCSRREGELLTLYRRVRRLLAAQVPLEITDLAVGGRELRGLGIPAGPLYGEILRDLLERVTDDPSLNTPERLLAIVRQRIQ
ncbi:HD domain-containing protein [soil metagenome]